MDYDAFIDSPNHGTTRPVTFGIVIHSTRGSAPSLEQEYQGTLNYFMNPLSEVSAHAVISHTGHVTRCVEESLMAFHAGWHNATWLGVELVQPFLGNNILQEQYQTLARFCRAMRDQFGFPLNLDTLVEHKDMPQGVASGKSDVSSPFVMTTLLEEIEWQDHDGDGGGSELTPSQREKLVRLRGGLRIWQRKFQQRANATAEGDGHGEDWEFDSSFEQRGAEEFASFSNWVEAVLEEG